MKTASNALKTFFQTVALGSIGAEFLQHDLYTFTLLDGTSYYYTDWSEKITGAYGPNGGTHVFLPLDPVNNGPGLKRSKVKSAVGLEVTSITIELIAPPTVQVTNATPILQALQQGVMDAAAVSVDRLVMATPTDFSLGTYNVFVGTVADVKGLGRIGAKITVRAITERLNTQYPQNLYQPSCRHTLYDAGCTLNRASFQVSGIVGSSSTTHVVQSNLSAPGPTSPPAAPALSYSTPGSGCNLIAETYSVVVTYVSALGESTYSAVSTLAVPAKSILHVASPSSAAGVIGWNVYVGKIQGDEQRQNLGLISIGTPWVESPNDLQVGAPPPPLPTGGYYTEGVVTFTSGALNGKSFHVDQYFSGGSFIITPALPVAPSNGDTFTIVPGCDKQMPTCNNKFSNLIHFGGQPFTPDPLQAL